MEGTTFSILSIPDKLEVLAIIPFGYPAQPVGKGRASRSPKSSTSGSPLNDVDSEGSFLAITATDQVI